MKSPQHSHRGRCLTHTAQRLCALIIGATLLFALGIAATNPAPPTYAKEVASILNARCVECHRPGEAAPMSLMTYKDVRPWVKSIKEKIVEKSMPPWLADPRFGHFENARNLSPKEIATIVTWVNAGAPKGDEKDLPPASEVTPRPL